MKYTLKKIKRIDREDIKGIIKGIQLIKEVEKTIEESEIFLAEALIMSPKDDEDILKQLSELKAQQNLANLNLSIEMARAGISDLDEMIDDVGEIEYCCGGIERTMEEKAIIIDKSNFQVYINPSRYRVELRFCPFCGSNIEKTSK